MRLPLRLGIEPLADSLFEVRFSSKAPAASILPGLLFSALPGEKKVERLPQADIPAPIRALSPELKYAPTSRIEYGKFFLNIGDCSFSVSCKMPYPGWAEFRLTIDKVMLAWLSADVPETIERCSFKSTNIIDRKFGPPKDVVTLSLAVGDRDLREALFHVRAEVVENNLVHIIQVAAEGVMPLADGSSRTGTVLDIDTIFNLNIAGDEFLGRLADAAEYMHDKNKEVFFSCLVADFLPKLEPFYG